MWKHLFLTLFVLTFELKADTVRRAAFDFGSGKIKLQVADVEEGKIVQFVYQEDAVVLLSEDSAKHQDFSLSEEVQNRAIETAQRLKQKAVEHGATSFSGLATEAYRKAPNGQTLVDRYTKELDIPTRIISQEEEGRMGFLAMIAETRLDPQSVVSWDIGGGSFQITYTDQQGAIQVYMAPFGRITTKNALITHVKKSDPALISSPNPISQEEWEASLKFFDHVLPQVPVELQLKIQQPQVRLIGMSAHPVALRNLDTYYKHNILELLEDRLDKTDEQLALFHSAPISAVSELVLVYAILNKLQSNRVEYFRTRSGSTSGLLLAEEYWSLITPL